MNEIELGMTREEVIAILGEPDVKGGTSRKYPIPHVFKYGDIELWFLSGTAGTLYAIWNERIEKIIRQVENQE